MVPERVQPLRVRHELRIMTVKSESMLSQSLELEPHHRYSFCVRRETPFFFDGLTP